MALLGYVIFITIPVDTLQLRYGLFPKFVKLTPFDITLPSINSYDFACPDGNQHKPKIAAFREWLQKTIDEESADDRFRLGGRYIEND